MGVCGWVGVCTCMCSNLLVCLLQNLQDDQRAELETYVQTRAGLNDLYAATQRNLDTESKRRSQLEQELDMLKSIRTEKEVSQGLMHMCIVYLKIY